MDERGTSMTDTGPLVKIKQSLTRLKKDTTQMDLRIGVVCAVCEVIIWMMLIVRYIKDFSKT